MYSGKRAYRYRHENILTLKPFRPVSSVHAHYAAPDVAPQLQDALDQALRDEDGAQMMIDANTVNANLKTPSKNARGAHMIPPSAGRHRLSSTTTATGATTGTNNTAKVYPKSRGLVK
jgi:hypothetical protein